jgi:hypothetical protein
MDEQTVRVLLRLTARLSCAIFLFAFAGRAAARLAIPRTLHWLATFRGDAFLALAFSHTLHLLWIIAGLIVTHGALVHMPWLTAIFGGLGFACIYFLAAAHLPRTPERRMPYLAEPFAVYYVWTIFFLAMLAKSRHSVAHAATAVLLLATLVANLAGARRQRRLQVIPIAVRRTKVRSQAS